MRRRRFERREYPQVSKCFFCVEKKNPDFKDGETLKRCLSERGRIVSRKRSGVCAKHQRRLAREIKRARYLALLPLVL